MTNSIIAKRYAKALFAVGKEDGQLDKYCETLGALSKLVTGHPEIKDALINPLYPLEIREKVMGHLIKALSASQIMANFLNLLLHKRRAVLIPDIAKTLEDMEDAHQNVCRGTVTTATPIDEGLMDKIQQMLERVTSKRVIVEKKVDPWIIGGLVAKVGDLVVDGSIRTQLMGLKDSIKRSE